MGIAGDVAILGVDGYSDEVAIRDTDGLSGECAVEEVNGIACEVAVEIARVVLLSLSFVRGLSLESIPSPSSVSGFPILATCDAGMETFFLRFGFLAPFATFPG